MKKLRAVLLILTLSLVALTVTVYASSLNNISATQPWKVQLLDGDETNVKNLSTAFGGNRQVPMMTYLRLETDGDYWIHFVHESTESSLHNCGSGNNWSCTLVKSSGTKISNGTMSDVSVFQIIDTFKFGVAFKSDTGYIYVHWQEYTNEMVWLDWGFTQIIDLSLFAGSSYVLSGSPSLIVDGFYYKIAFIIRDLDTNVSRLVYAYRNPGNTSPCLAGSDYECDVIATFVGSSGTPSLAKSGDTVGIAYYDPSVDDVMYAYPHIHSIIYPSNCGPGDPKTWRCISIYGTGDIGANVQLASGQTNVDIGIVFTRDDTMIPNTLYVANYVGSGGNCGVDKNILGENISKWQCTALDDLTYNNFPSYSIQMDLEGYPVVAYDFVSCDTCYNNLFLIYPNEHVGLPGPGWVKQKIDGVISGPANIGGQASLALNRSGRGFLAYISQADYVNPAIKIALQWYTAYLPTIMK